MLNDLDRYNRKIREDLLLEYNGLQFYTTWGLFSPRAIDDGSRLLLDYLEFEKDSDCLDLGCGYGVLGLCMARAAPAGHTLLVDKDFVAVEYSEKNRRHNRIENASCLLSNGFAQIPRQRFDVIVSNIPAKVGREMLYIYLFDALEYLKPGPAALFTSSRLPDCASFSSAALPRCSVTTKRSSKARTTPSPAVSSPEHRTGIHRRIERFVSYPFAFRCARSPRKDKWFLLPGRPVEA